MIKKKLGEYIVGLFTEKALKVYCQGNYGASLEGLSVEQLLALYKDIDENTPAVNEIFKIASRIQADSRSRSAAYS